MQKHYRHQHRHKSDIDCKMVTLISDGTVVTRYAVHAGI